MMFKLVSAFVPNVFSITLGRVRSVGDVPEDMAFLTVSTLNKWSESALSQCPETIRLLFGPNSTFSGTMADRVVSVNNGERLDNLTHYMKKFLPGLKGIVWKDVLLTSQGESCLATGTYVFIKSSSDTLSFTEGHFTFLVDKEGKIRHHQSAVKVPADRLIEMPLGGLSKL